MKPWVLTYKDAKSLVICGDIHGEFVPLVYEMCVRYGMRDTLVIVAGDCGFGHNIEHFEREIGDADNVLIILSDLYFYSINCMYELALVVKNRKHKKPPVLVSLDDFSRKDEQYNTIYAYWEKQLEQIRQNMCGDRNRDLPFLSDFEKVQLILENFGEAWKLIRDINTLTFEQVSENQFRKLIAHIKKEVLIDDETMDEIEAGVPVERTEQSPVINITQNGPKSIAQVINSGTSIINL